MANPSQTPHAPPARTRRHGASPIVYCVEGHWQWDDPSAEPSVEPLLQMLQRQGLLRYVRRNAATADELFYWMRNEWNSCAYGSILYFATHGEEGEIWLGGEGVPIEKLAKKIDCERCLVHFSGCSTLACSEERIRHFMKKSGAAAVSGYRCDVGWTSSSWPPAALCDLMLLSEIGEQRVNLADGRSRPRSEQALLSLKKKLQERFEDCGFDLHLKDEVH